MEMTKAQKIRYVQDTLFVIGGKWKLPILVAILQGNHRFREIHRSVLPITTRVLSKELKNLEENKLVARTVQSTTPPTVEYTLTEYCKTLTRMINEMIAWGKNHRETISGTLES
ncbi:helix-turn-helix transcriptional regulator (plasmid) [Adhaeribacter swui]|uniref:Helix-turn-helix transcriptional regulator n=1 Tax=Adhaeribacter swui TaxID=2086471 RepID=A0A7G7G2L7_9BACT|nr:helix-turn-helix domain-containing protein [Adhaeribacter swui]QNF31401.1 helix-turn-helix transcriptional regulator [Adhaeribacter swui]